MLSGVAGYSAPVPGPSPATPHGGSPSIHQPDHWWYRARSQMLRTVLEPYVGTADRLLDVGSADGPSVGWLSAGQLVSLDLDPRGLRPPTGICGSVLALPFADASFEVVSAFDVLEHCDPEALALAELSRVLEPGGRLLLSVPAYQWAWSDHDVANGHHRRYTRPRAVRAVQAAGFDVLRATYGFSAVFPAFAADRLLRSVRHRFGSSGPEGPSDVVDLAPVNPVLERALLGLSALDRRALARRDLPFGSSVFLAAAKR
jgi:SAM-dependent methyltransferase